MKFNSNSTDETSAPDWGYPDKIDLSALNKPVLMDRADEVLVALRRVMRATDLHSKQLVKQVGLTAPQLLIMQLLHRHGSMPSGELAQRVSLSQATVTSILDRLAAKGLVSRERSEEDRRKVFILLTESGAAKIADAPTPLQEHFVKQFGDLKDWEQAQIISALQRIAHMMDAHHIDAAPVLDSGDIHPPAPSQ